jgi:hypothetical protein
MSSFYPPKMEPRPMSAALAADLVCRNCRTSLQGLAFDAQCPKCGAAVSLSMRGDLIRYSDPKWIDRLRFGVNLSVWSFIASCVGLAGYFFFQNQSRQIIDPAIPLSVEIVGSVMDLLGSWLYTSRDPCGLGENRYGKVRKAVRVFMVINLLLVAFLAAQEFGTLPPGIARAAGVVGVICQWVFVVSLSVRLRYLSELATRIRDTLLTERARFLSRAIGISAGIFIGMGLLMTLGKRRPDCLDDSFTDCLGVVYLVTGAALSVFLIMNILLLVKFGRRLKEQSRLARQVWDEAYKNSDTSTLK